MREPAVEQAVCPQCGAVNRLPRARLREHPRCGKCAAELLSGQPLTLTPATFDRQLTRGTLPLLVDFWAPWCGPCRVMAPVFEQAAKALAPGVRFGKVNTEDAPALAERFAIRSIPTLILFDRGAERARQSGALSGPALLAWVRGALAGLPGL